VLAPRPYDKAGGEGLCMYLLDPTVAGWDSHFDGSGSLGFVGKKGAIVGVGIDCGGDFSEGHPGSVVIKRASDNTLLCDPVKPEAFGSTSGIITSKWKKLKIKFDIEENTITVKLGEIKILDDIKIKGVEIPRSVCVGVCAATSATRSNRVCVNKLKLKAEADDDDMGKSKADIVPPGCVDYKVEGGVLCRSNQAENWRCAGNAKLGQSGFELTQRKLNQEGHLLCRKPLKCAGSEIHASFEYVLAPRPYDKAGGEGLCMYLLDPTVAGWDSHFDGSGSLGFVGKKGAIVGVGIDQAGNFAEGRPGTVAIKRADNTLMCEPVKIDAGVLSNKWIKVQIRFEIQENTIDVHVGGVHLLKEVPLDGVTIPRVVCVGVCGATSATRNNLICVNKVKLHETLDK